MHTVTSRFILLLQSCGACALLLLLLIGQAGATPAAAAAAPSLAEALNPDGTLRAGASGSFDARRYKMLTGPDGRPTFRPAGVLGTTGAGDDNWQSGLGTAGTDGIVNAVLPVGTDIYIGGSFTSVGGVAVANVAKWNGSAWSSVGYISSGTVSSLAMVGTTLFAGGSFRSAGATLASSTQVNYLARWNGTAWGPVGPSNANGVQGYVYALAASGTSLYVGGSFANAGSIAANNVARWDNATSTWSALVSGTSNGVTGYVAALTFNDTGTELYVGGEFTRVVSTGPSSNVTTRHVVRWIIASNTWGLVGTASSHGLSSNFQESVAALVVVGNTVYVGGKFTRVGLSVSASNVARCANNVWTPLSTGITHSTATASVSSIAVSGTTVYVGGSFTHINTTPINNVAKFDGSTWTALSTGLTDGRNNTFVQTVRLVGSSLYVGGSFRQAGSVVTSGLALWSGTAWSCPAPGTGADGHLNAIVLAGSNVYVGGDFTHIGGITANRVAKWDGSSWSSLGTGAANGVGAYPNTVNALAVADNGDVYVGGRFTTAGGASANRVAKWNGTAWSSLGTGTADGVNNTVRALAVIGTDVYVGGEFTQAGGVANAYLAKWNGTAWSTLGTGVSGPVYALAKIGTELYAGGQFTQAGGADIRSIAKWNGTAWSPLGGTGVNSFDGSVMALAVSGANLYAGGGFTIGSGMALNKVAKWNGSTWSPLGTSDVNGVSGSVLSLAAIGNDVYVGGNFFEVGGSWNTAGVSTHCIARWTGSAWSALGSGLGRWLYSDNYVNALAVDVDYKVYAGGDFTTVGDGSKATSFYGIFADTPPSLTVAANQPLDGSYNNLTITGAGAALLTAPLRVRGTLTIQSGGQLLTAGQPITGAGNFVLASGATLGISDPAGIAATGATGAVQVSGTRTFDAGASYRYIGTQAQVAGPALPASVAGLVVDNPAGLTLSQNLTTTQALTLTSGQLNTGAATVTLGPTATITETATGYVTGAVETSRPVATPGQPQNFGGLGLELTPALTSTTLPGTTTVRRITGTAPTGSTSVGMGRYFDITATNHTGLDLTMQARYRDEELNGVPEGNLVFYRSASGAAGPWVAQTGTYTRDALNNQLTLTGVSGFSVWTLGSGGSGVLPVELVAFRATARGAGVQLAWRTASETGSAYFAVERSFDGRAFTDLNTVAAQGTRATSTEYAYWDAAPFGAQALLYYRLRQVDADGSFHYSPVRTVAVAPTAGLALLPNPAQATATLKLAAAPQDREVRVLDVRGRVVVRALLPAHANAAVLSLTGLPAGIYAVRVGSATVRLVVE